jgi:hypothetical protein
MNALLRIIIILLVFFLPFPRLLFPLHFFVATSRGRPPSSLFAAIMLFAVIIAVFAASVALLFHQNPHNLLDFHSIFTLVQNPRDTGEIAAARAVSEQINAWKAGGVFDRNNEGGWTGKGKSHTPILDVFDNGWGLARVEVPHVSASRLVA